MSYKITDLDEYYFSELENEVRNNFQELVRRLSNNYNLQTPMRPSEVNRGGQKYNFSLIADLRLVFDFAIGEKPAPDYLHEILQNVCELVWTSPFQPGNNYEIKWKEWRKTRLGFLIYMAYQRVDLEKGKDFSAADLAQLTGLTKSAITYQIREGNIETEKENNQWVIPNKEAIKFIKSRNDLPFYDNLI